MKVCAVLDTNVVLSALITKNEAAATVKVLDAVFSGVVTPLYHPDILREYDEVFHRDKFHLSEVEIQAVLSYIRRFGIEVFPQPTGEILIDADDLVFYEVALEKREENAYLVTGNQRHYPVRDFIVTPAELVDILSL